MHAGSIFFAIAIRQAAAHVNRTVQGQILRFIVDDFASAGPPELVKKAASLSVVLASDLGLRNHQKKTKLVCGRATTTALEAAGYVSEEIEIVPGMVFAGRVTADVRSVGGQRFIEDFHDTKLAAFKFSARRLRSLVRKQDAFVILISCLTKRIDHLFFNAPMTLNLTQLGHVCERRDSILRSTLAWLVEESSLRGCSWLIAGLPFRHRGLGFNIGTDHPIASAVAFASEYELLGGASISGSQYGAAVQEWSKVLCERAPGVAEVITSEVRGRRLARILAVRYDSLAGGLSDALPRRLVKQRYGLPQDGGFLRAIGTHSAEHLTNSSWLGSARQLLTLPLLSSFEAPMESSDYKELCLKCRAKCLDPYGFHAMECPSQIQALVHTNIKNAVYDFVRAVACSPGSRVRKVEIEQPGLVDDGMRPGDVSFEFQDRLYAADVFSVDSSALSNMEKGVEELFIEAADEKQAKYAAACAEQDVTFFAFGIDVMGRLSGCAESFIRWMCNCIPDPVCGRSRLVHYWSRRVVVTSMEKKMSLLLRRQRSMSPCHSRFESLAT